MEQNGKCVCRPGTRLTPDKTDCVEELLYSTVSDDAFACKDGLVFVGGECRPATGKTWADLVDVCSAAGRVVNRAGSECVAKCDALEMEVEHVCACVSHTRIVDQTGKCVCLTDNFVQKDGACVCRQGTFLDPAGTDCVEELLYADVDGDSFVCRDGL